MKLLGYKTALNQSRIRCCSKTPQPIALLRSNYKYKRRQSAAPLRRIWRYQEVQSICRHRQSLPLPAGGGGDKAAHSSTKKSGCLSAWPPCKFPRIFILIMQLGANRRTSSTPCLRLIGTLIAGSVPGRGAVARCLAGAGMECHINARPDANEDNSTECESKALQRSDGRFGDGRLHQRGNYDKVSTITSSPPLSCHRQARVAAPAAQLSLQAPLGATTCGTGQLWATLRHRREHDKASTSEHLVWPRVTSGSIDANRSHMKSCHMASRTCALSPLVLMLLALAFGVQYAAAGACWQTVQGSGKCNDIFSFNVSRSDCCGANQEFAYTEREPTSVEYFFATAIGGGMECQPCLESCRNVRCGPNKKCVKRKGRPKCVCAPECGAARRRRLQREQLQLRNVNLAAGADMQVVSRPPRDTHSLSSEISHPDVGNRTQNQRKFIHIHMQQDYAHQQEAPKKRLRQQSKGHRRRLLAADAEHTEKPTARRIQLFSNVRTTFARRYFGQQGASDLSSDEHSEEQQYEDEAEEEEEEEEHVTASSYRNDDVTRLANLPPSRHKAHSHDRESATTKAQEGGQHSRHNQLRHPSVNGPDQHHHSYRRHHHHQHQGPDGRAAPSGQPHSQGRRKHEKQHHREGAHTQKHSAGRGHHGTTSTTTASNTFAFNEVDYHTASASSPTTGLTLASTSSGPYALLPTTPVNSTASAARGDGQNARLADRGNEAATATATATSFSLPLSSSSMPSASASTHSYLPTAFATTSALGTSSPQGGGVLRPPHHRDRNGRLKTTPPIAAAATTNSYYDDDNDNTISTMDSNSYHRQLHAGHRAGVHGVLDHSQMHGHTQLPATITITENIKPSNPVCGTDGRTYNTECQLRKRACRTDNPNLQVAYRGHCKTSCNGVNCLSGLTCVEDQYTMPHCIACRIQCPLDDYDSVNDIVDATRSVCGADGKTYKSMCDINRIICKIGRSIGVAYPGPCRADQVTCDDINCGPKQVCLVDLMTHQPRCTPCRYKCSRKRRPASLYYEEQKICGVNNRTYNSWCEMRKDSCSTGFYIDVKYPGHCH